MEESLQVIKGYFDGCKKGEEPVAYTQLTFLEFRKIGRFMWLTHELLVKDLDQINIQIIDVEKQELPFKRLKVVFSLNGDHYQAILVREKRPDTAIENLMSWQNQEGQLGINPCSIRRLNSK